MRRPALEGGAAKSRNVDLPIVFLRRGAAADRDTVNFDSIYDDRRRRGVIARIFGKRGHRTAVVDPDAIRTQVTHMYAATEQREQSDSCLKEIYFKKRITARIS